MTERISDSSRIDQAIQSKKGIVNAFRMATAASVVVLGAASVEVGVVTQKISDTRAGIESLEPLPPSIDTITSLATVTAFTDSNPTISPQIGVPQAQAVVEQYEEVRKKEAAAIAKKGLDRWSEGGIWTTIATMFTTAFAFGGYLLSEASLNRLESVKKELDASTANAREIAGVETQVFPD